MSFPYDFGKSIDIKSYFVIYSLALIDLLAPDVSFESNSDALGSH